MGRQALNGSESSFFCTLNPAWSPKSDVVQVTAYVDGTEHLVFSM